MELEESDENFIPKLITVVKEIHQQQDMNLQQ
jgi:hypothetical protein